MDDVFAGHAYVDPSEILGDGLLAARLRYRFALDPTNGTMWTAIDHITFSESLSGEPLADRTVQLFRGFGQEQIEFRLLIDERTIAINGLGAATFIGNPEIEFSNGIRIIAQYGI